MLFRSYEMTRKTRGGLFEAGTFLGRSTSVFCEAIRKEGQVGRKFVSYDLSLPSEVGFKHYMQSIGHTDEQVCPPKELTDIWAAGTSSTELARKNLASHGLLDHVELRIGDFRQDSGVYETLFFDVVHGMEEAAANLPHIVRLSAPKAVVGIHDMFWGGILEHVIEKTRGELSFFRLVDTLALFQRI